LPSNDEWNQLVSFAGGKRKAGKRLKSKPPDWNGTDKFKFSAMPGGGRLPDNTYGSPYWLGNWWTATEYDSSDAYFWVIDVGYIEVCTSYRGKEFCWLRIGNWYYGMFDIDVYRNSKESAYSVRCLKD
jgi:uncharacterized protein (TIGR02145 family)